MKAGSRGRTTWTECGETRPNPTEPCEDCARPEREWYLSAGIFTIRLFLDVSKHLSGVFRGRRRRRRRRCCCCCHTHRIFVSIYGCCCSSSTSSSFLILLRLLLLLLAVVAVAVVVVVVVGLFHLFRRLHLVVADAVRRVAQRQVRLSKKKAADQTDVFRDLIRRPWTVYGRRLRP